MKNRQDLLRKIIEREMRWFEVLEKTRDEIGNAAATFSRSRKARLRMHPRIKESPHGAVWVSH